MADPDRSLGIGTPVDDQRRRPSDHDATSDAGRTSGGGSLGHDQPDDVERATGVRNATGSESDPVMPADDSTLKTKI